MNRRSILFCALLWLAAEAAVADNTNLKATFTTRTARIEKMTEGGSLVVFSIARTQAAHQWGRSVIWRDVLTDDDADGAVQVDTPEDIEPDRLWVFVDQTSGSYLVQRTDGPHRKLRGGTVRHEQDNRGRKLRLGNRTARVLVVRPGAEAWLDIVEDGGGADDDGTINGETIIRAGKLKGFKNSDKRADKFDKGDTVIVIDPITLAVDASRVE